MTVDTESTLSYKPQNNTRSFPPELPAKHCGQEMALTGGRNRRGRRRPGAWPGATHIHPGDGRGVGPYQLPWGGGDSVTRYTMIARTANDMRDTGLLSRTVLLR